MGKQTLRSRLGAWWWLLLLVCIMAPEAAMLRLHTHHYTAEASWTKVGKSGTVQAEISGQHQYCHTEQLFKAAYQPSMPLVVPQPLLALRYPAYRVLVAGCPVTGLVTYQVAHLKECIPAG